MRGARSAVIVVMGDVNVRSRIQLLARLLAVFKSAPSWCSERQMACAAKWAQAHGATIGLPSAPRQIGAGISGEAVEGGRIPNGSALVVEGLDRLGVSRAPERQPAQIVNAGITVVIAGDRKIYNLQPGTPEGPTGSLAQTCRHWFKAPPSRCPMAARAGHRAARHFRRLHMPCYGIFCAVCCPPQNPDAAGPGQRHSGEAFAACAAQVMGTRFSASGQTLRASARSACASAPAFV